jgi:RNA ligase
MTQLSDIVDITEMTAAVHAGFIRVQTHPTLPLKIAGYSAKAQANWHWDPITTALRGVIYNETTGEVVARPFAKFFEVSQTPEVDYIDPAEDIWAFDKIDGSLGIIYPTVVVGSDENPQGQQEYAVASRGSFQSDQARKATELLRTKYRDYQPHPYRTTLVEIVYPENRIVCDYGTDEKLVYLGEISILTGYFHYDPESWPVEADVSAPLYQGPYKQLFDLPDRQGAEGYVVWSPRTDARVKVKYDEYLRLHKIVTGLSRKTVWEHMRDTRDFTATQLIEKLPLAHGQWVQGVAAEIRRDYTHAHLVFAERGMQLCSELGLKKLQSLSREHRKAVAMAIKDDNPMVKAAIFSSIDGKGTGDLLWKACQPPPERNNAPDDEVVLPPRV